MLFWAENLRFQFFFSGLRTQPTNRPPVRDYDPDTPLEISNKFLIDIRQLKFISTLEEKSM